MALLIPFPLALQLFCKFRTKLSKEDFSRATAYPVIWLGEEAETAWQQLLTKRK